MVDIIHQIALKELINIEKDFYDVVSKQGDISEFTMVLEEKLKNIGKAITKEFLEDLNKKAKDDPNRKKKWNVERNKNETTLMTVFGEVSYNRTYYVSKKGSEYKFLSDEMVGIKPHQRVETLVESKIIDEAIETTYQKAATPFGLSRQKVLNTIRELEKIEQPKIKRTDKKKVEYLYIEADEDHVSLQKGGTSCPKIVYIHEGFQEVIGENKRHKLKNVRYIAGEYKGSWDIWKEAYEYISDNYDVENIKKIYISGDGAPWIKAGVEYIDKSVFVLDKYHLNKYILMATGHVKKMRFELWDAINKGQKSRVKNTLSDILMCVDSTNRANKVIECRRYLLNNWEGIIIYNKDSKHIVGCSAEGHVSHLLSARLSSRPMGWSIENEDNIARLRAFKKNGGNIYNLILNNKENERVRLPEKYFKTLKRNIKKNINMKSEVEIPIIKYGKTTPTYIALNALRQAY